jgi:hypothetical protein
LIPQKRTQTEAVEEIKSKSLIWNTNPESNTLVRRKMSCVFKKLLTLLKIKKYPSLKVALFCNLKKKEINRKDENCSTISKQPSLQLSKKKV